MASKLKTLLYIIDDNKSYGEALQRSLEVEGFDVKLFTSPLDAVNQFKIKPPDAAVVDCMLPKKNGIEFVREIRANGYDALPVILISGIFRDKQYIQKAIDKTKAVAFLTKPFEIPDLVMHLFESIPKSVGKKKNPMAKFLMSGMISKKKVADSLNKVTSVIGYEIPVLINSILYSKLNGSLHVTVGEDNIMSLQFSEGNFISVDSSNSTKLVRNILLKNGYVDHSDLTTEVLTGDLIANLIDECLISPHLISAIKSEQIKKELDRILIEDKLQIKFSESSEHEFDFKFEASEFVRFLEQKVNNEISEIWLQAYYEQWMTSLVKYGPSHNLSHPIFEAEVMKRCQVWLDNVDDEITLSELLSRNDEVDYDDKYKCLHLLVLHNFIVFEDESATLKQLNDLERLESIHELLAMKNPIEVYKYFGASPLANKNEIDKIYKELAKIYHPDKLSDSATEKQRAIADEIFRIIANAHAVLTNEDKRKSFDDQMKQKDAEKQLKAETILEDGIKALRRNRVNDAIILLEISSELHHSQAAKIYISWAKIKQAESSNNLTSEVLGEIKNLLDLVPEEDRKTAEYYHTMGLYNKAVGKEDSARSHFKRALTVDGGFIESRRELSLLGDKMKTTKSSNTVTDFLNQDIGTMVTKLFKKKSS